LDGAKTPVKKWHIYKPYQLVMAGFCDPSTGKVSLLEFPRFENRGFSSHAWFSDGVTIFSAFGLQPAMAGAYKPKIYQKNKL